MSQPSRKQRDITSFFSSKKATDSTSDVVAPPPVAKRPLPDWNVATLTALEKRKTPEDKDTPNLKKIKKSKTIIESDEEMSNAIPMVSSSPPAAPIAAMQVVAPAKIPLPVTLTSSSPPGPGSILQELPSSPISAPDRKFPRRGFVPRTGPAHPGSKPIPVGERNCLQGLTFVFTGEMDSLSREEAMDLVKSHGGRVTGAPSSRTSYMVVGAEAGPSKLEKAKTLKIKVIDEDALLELVMNLPGKDIARPSAPKQTINPATIATTEAEIEDGAINGGDEFLWTEKYRPKKSQELCGNKSIIEQLRNFLKNWKPSNPKKAVLLSGPPGIGKTTAAHVVSKEEGYQVTEFNASETRSKSRLEVRIFLASSHGIASYSKKGKTVIVMDEVDGMSAGDRGGITQLIQYIKKTKTPIICICNDHQSPKIRSLVNHCLDLKFRRPQASMVRARLLTITSREHLSINPEVLDELVQAAHSDIRQVLNTISTWSATSRGNELSYYEAKEIGEAAKKHIQQGPFEVVGRFFRRKESLTDLLEAYFYDYSISPLMVQENYINVGSADISDIANAADSISEGDLLDAVIHGTEQNWSMLPLHGVMSCCRPAFMLKGGQMQGMYRFPSWLGQNSKALKYQRLLTSLLVKMRLSGLSLNRTSFRQSFLPYLHLLLVEPLVTNGQEGIPEVIDLLDAYFLNKDDMDTLNDLEEFTGIPKDISFKDLPVSLKSAFTRAYNKASHPGAAIVFSVDIAKLTAVKGTRDVTDWDEVLEEEEEIPESEVEDPTYNPNQSSSSKNKASNKGRGGGSVRKKTAGK